VSNLRVDSPIVTIPSKEGTVSSCLVVRGECTIRFFKHAWNKSRQPFIIDNVLVGSDCELASTVEQELIIIPAFKKYMIRLAVRCTKLPCPEVMNTKPEDPKRKNKRILMTTYISHG
jgi:hypothetical protein